MRTLVLEIQRSSFQRFVKLKKTNFTYDTIILLNNSICKT